MVAKLLQQNAAVLQKRVKSKIFFSSIKEEEEEGYNSQITARKQGYFDIFAILKNYTMSSSKKKVHLKTNDNDILLNICVILVKLSVFIIVCIDIMSLLAFKLDS